MVDDRHTPQAAAVASPIATGGGGEDFERRLAAFALALLLARAQAPVLRDAVVVEVHLQTRRLGWRTDDVLVVAEVRPGATRRLAIQAKRSFTVSASNQECAETICGMWDDFCAGDRFDPAVDRLAIATLNGTATLLRDFNSLLMCARAAVDGADFRQRLAPEGYLSQKTRAQHEALLAILREHLGEEPDGDRYWEFLRVVTVLSYDLGTSTAQSESMALTLLTFVAGDVADPRAVAHSTWASLLDIASAGRQAAASYRRDSLPADLLALHRVVPSADDSALRELAAHGRAVRDGIRETISGSFALERAQSLDELFAAVNAVSVVVVAGSAGSGKSALAKALLDRIEVERPVLAFQAVEFATPHLNDTLARTQAGVTVRMLPALLAAHDRTTILVESLERLLEHDTRDAFAQLLRLVATTPAVRIVLTCRDYSLETVRSALIEPSGVAHTVVEIGLLTDEDLSMVAAGVPALEHPLGDARMREFLRTPHMLDMASRIDWLGTPLPNSLRAFRERCWRDLVRDDAFRSAAMPARREAAFIAVAHSRASQLHPYVRLGEPDLEALDALLEASLLVAAPGASGLYAPAHDVLEDWAILKWLDDLAVATDDAPMVLAGAVAGFPALRRGLRKWLAERLDVDPEAGVVFILTVNARAELPAYFRDDCVVAALLSDAAGSFVDGCGERVAAGNTGLLRQLVHLARVACKAPPAWLTGRSMQSPWLTPVGPAWGPLLELVGGNLPVGADADAHLYVSLVEDWARQLTISTTDPAGAEPAGRIASHLLTLFDGYGFQEVRKRTIEIVLKIPRHAPAFTDLAQRAIRPAKDDGLAEEFAGLAVATLTGAFVCRDFPAIITAIVRTRVLMSGAEGRTPYYSPIEGVDACFGIRAHGHVEFFPASAVQGPFHTLLQHHPRAGVDFVLEFANHAGAWYGERRWPGHHLEPAERLSINIPDTGAIEQWVNWRLYALYRGMSVGPHVLQSALMALEAWLLRIATFDGVDFEGWLLYILRQSNSVLTTGVVASACVAQPVRAGRATLAILSDRNLIRLDRARLSSESAISNEFLAGLNPSHVLFEDERRRANGLTHRREDLEALAVRLQSTPLRDELWALIDRHREALSGDDEEALLWRLALHRMDLRGFRVAEVQPNDSPDASTGETLVVLELANVEPEVQMLVDTNRDRMVIIGNHLRLLNAATAAWERTASADLTEWRKLQAAAKALVAEEAAVEEYARGGGGITAAVGVRDHLSELELDELQWCVSHIVQALGGDAAGPDHEYEYARHFGPDRATAAVLALLVAKVPEQLPDGGVDLLARTLTHRVVEIADFAYAGAGAFLGREYDDLVIRCATAAVRVAEWKEAARERRNAADYFDGEDVAVPAMNAGGRAGPGPADEAAAAGRAALEADVELAQDAIRHIEVRTWEGRTAARRIFALFERRSDLPSARDFAFCVARWLAEVWGRTCRDRAMGDRDYHGEADLSRRLAGFALRLPSEVARSTCAPLIGLAASEPNEIEKFVSELVLAADKASAPEAYGCFWALWQAFADSAVVAVKEVPLDRDRHRAAPLVQRLFLVQSWKQSSTTWTPLDGQGWRLHELARNLPPATEFVRAYTRFLHDIGRLELPAAFISIDEIVSRGDVSRLLADANITFQIESLLSQFVYGEPARLKSDAQVRAAVLHLLDELVAAGSSAAYRMRDDFVTPHRGAS